MAIKYMARGRSSAKFAEREIMSLRLCVLHPYIVSIWDVFLTPDHIAMVMEYARGGTLSQYIKLFKAPQRGRGISEERARWIFVQVPHYPFVFCSNGSLRLTSTL